jgi:DNA-binding XRE family transcriptional regulator/methylmalonyl-CoA mutase cobalamin-binding subunit
VDDERHAIGARMAADFLLVDGWAVDYLGASTPTTDLAEFVRRRAPDVVALSVTQAEYLGALRVAAAALRRLTPAPGILAGGAALRGRSRTAATLGVDAVTTNALAGVHEARRLTAGAGGGQPRTPDDYFELLGRRVQELRSRKGWTQQALAQAAGLDRTYISGLERGKQNPTIGALLRVTRALDVPLDRLVIPRVVEPADPHRVHRCPVAGRAPGGARDAATAAGCSCRSAAGPASPVHPGR